MADDLKRRKKIRQRNHVIAVAYDGRRTEAEYFKGWQRKTSQSGVTLLSYCVTSGGNPLEAVKAVVKKTRSDRDFDELWCVTDQDDASSADVAAAKTLAGKHNIRLILSVRCFEVWLALHFGRISTAPVESEADAIGLVREHYPPYCARSKSIPFGTLYPLTPKALDNARWLEQQGHLNPRTDVHHLVQALHDKLQ